MRKLFFATFLVSGCLTLFASLVRASTHNDHFLVQGQGAQLQKGLATLHGRVVDARKGEPMAKVKVIVNGSDQSATTDDKGAFTIANVLVGQLDLYITTVSYGLVKKTIVLKEGENSEALIALNDDAATLTEKVSVAIDPYEGTETNAASEQMIN